MKYNPDIHHRRSIRLKHYDYSQAGAYFVTICTKDRECLFGELVDGKMILNDVGEMIRKVWDDLPIKYSGINIDEYIVMPNHIHGIIVIVGAGLRACPYITQSDIKGQPQGVAPTKLSLIDVVHRFKSFTTSRFRLGIEQHNWPQFNGKLWQRNYYEHIIRNETEMNKIREYIINNPLNWESDENYKKCPLRTHPGGD